MPGRPITDYGALTFDCFGTLVDWESGIYNMLLPLRQQLTESHPHYNDRMGIMKLFIKNEGIVQRAAREDGGDDAGRLGPSVRLQERRTVCRPARDRGLPRRQPCVVCREIAAR